MRFPLNQLGENERILEHLREAERLAETLDDQLRLGRVSAYLTTYYYVVCNQERAVASGQRALAIATALGNFPLQVELNFRLGQVYHQIGEYRVAMNFHSRNVENVVVYLLVADNVSRLLPIRQRRVHQPVSSSQNGFSTPHSTLLA